jgi:hypothetical protein
MNPILSPLRALLVTLAGWVNRHQQDLIEYLAEGNRVLKEQLTGRRLRLTDDQRRRLADGLFGFCQMTLGLCTARVSLEGLPAPEAAEVRRAAASIRAVARGGDLDEHAAHRIRRLTLGEPGVVVIPNPR